MQARIQQQLNKIKQAKCYRPIIYKQPAAAPYININGIEYLNFASSDYLGLSNNKAVIAAGYDAAQKYGAGSNASSWVTGLTETHQALKQTICQWLDQPACCLFSSGFMANLGVVNALINRHDIIFHDKKNHASLLDAVKLSNAKNFRYRHLDYSHLNKLIKKNQSNPFGWLITDAVFSMSGKTADLNTLAALANDFNYYLIADDAHGIGVLGDNGSGATSSLACNNLIKIITFGKAIGTMGAAVVSSQKTIDLIEQSARSFGFSTAMPPSIAASSLASINLIINQPEIRQKLLNNIDYFKKATAAMGVEVECYNTAIIRAYATSPKAAVDWANNLKKQGIWTQAVRPPSVSLKDTGLRITISAQHSFSHLNKLAKALYDTKA